MDPDPGGPKNMRILRNRIRIPNTAFFSPARANHCKKEALTWSGLVGTPAQRSLATWSNRAKNRTAYTPRYKSENISLVDDIQSTVSK
jgi:hypothetical protein